MKRLIIVFLISILTTQSVCHAQTVEQADSLHQLGRELVNDGKITEGRECTRQAMEIRKKLLGEVSEDYITSLNNYAYSFGAEKNWQKAVELQEQVMKLCGKLKTPHKNLGMYTTNMGRYYYFINDKAKAAHMWEQALPLVEKHGDIYEFLLNSLGAVYSDTRDQQGMSRIMALMEEHNQNELTKPCDEPECMLERAQYYESRGETAKAKEHFLKVVGMRMSNEIKVRVYEAYAQFLSHTKDYIAAAENQLIAAQAQHIIDGNSETHANLLYIAALYSFLGKQYQQAIDCHLTVASFYANKQTDAARRNEVKCWTGIGNAYSGLKQYDQARVYHQRVVDYYAKNAPNDNEYPKAIMRMATAEKFGQEYESSIEHHLLAMKIFEERGMSEDYVNAANSLQMCYIYAKKPASERSDAKMSDAQLQAAKASQIAKLDDIIKQEEENIELTRIYFGKLAYARSLQNLAGCYSMKNEHSKSVEYYKQYMEAIREAVRDEFRMQSETERIATWSREVSSIKQLQEQLVGLPDNNDRLKGELSAIAYDAALLSKGILLNSSIEFEKVLRAENNPELMDIYHKTKSNEEEIKRLRANATSNADLEKIVQLSQETRTLQLKLYDGCAEYADFTDYISHNWKTVQETLTSDDVAIEFTSVDPLFEGKDDYMVAIVLTKDMPHPTHVVLWNNEKLMECEDTPFHTQLQDSIMSRIINNNCDIDFIHKMQQKLEQTETNYKSELTLYLRRLETMIENDTTYRPVMANISLMQYNQLIDNNKLYDTPEVCNLIWGTLNSYISNKKRIFFSADGCFNRIGIEYLLYNDKPLSEQFEVYRLSSTKEICHKRKQEKLTKATLFGNINYNEEGYTPTISQNTKGQKRGAADDEAQFADLGNTRREVNEIYNILKGKGIDTVEPFTDTKASKTTFMSQSDTDVNILHIATHGIYDNKRKSTDAGSMEHSFLAFAGANIDDDALVTAADIATMNLRKCSLAVLSACETGLGKLGDDGVFGLQRGFKNAGVQTLLMSLKNVYDDSTADLMISFYKHLMTGATKREALVKAQKEIRSNGYNDPKHWAAFILLDGLD